MFNKLDTWISFSSLSLAIFMIVSILLFFRFLPPKLPLFYSFPWGDTQLANHQQFFIIPAGIILTLLFNTIIFWQLHPTQAFFKKVLLLSSLVTTLILTITFIKIVLIFI